METMDKCIVIIGANGFLGRYLADYYHKKGWSVRAIARGEKDLAESMDRGVEFYPWDGVSEGPWMKAFDGADVVVNLAGRTVNCRYNEKNKKQIFDSRTVTTKLVGKAIAEATEGPKVWLNSSTATIYRHAEDRPQTDEQGEIGSGFSVEVAKLWEKTLFEYPTAPDVRKIAIRTAIVMAKEPDTVLEVLTGLAKKGLGGKMGNGKQMVSWIHVHDFCRAINWLIEKEKSTGTYNLSAPNPVTNAAMMQQIRTYAGVRFGLPATPWMLKIGAIFMRTETELILKSRWVLPTRLQAEGFEFEIEEFKEVLQD